MALSVTPIKEIPESTHRWGARDSKCLDVVEAALHAPEKKVSVESSDEKELDKFYKSMIQWRTRHQEQPVALRKDRNKLYVWIPEVGEIVGRRRKPK